MGPEWFSIYDMTDTADDSDISTSAELEAMRAFTDEQISPKGYVEGMNSDQNDNLYIATVGITAASNALFADISPKKSLEDALLCDIFDKYAEQLFKDIDEIIGACTERQLPVCDRTEVVAEQLRAAKGTAPAARACARPAHDEARGRAREAMARAQAALAEAEAETAALSSSGDNTTGMCFQDGLTFVWDDWVPYTGHSFQVYGNKLDALTHTSYTADADVWGLQEETHHRAAAQPRDDRGLWHWHVRE